METIRIIASSSVLIVLVQGLFEILRFYRERRAKQKDDKKQNVEARLTKIEEQNKAQSEALKYVMYDRIKKLGSRYIEEGEIDFDDRRQLNERHAAYHNGLHGNGDLDDLMHRVNSLPLKGENHGAER